MQTIPFVVALICLIVNLVREVDALEAVTRSMIVYVAVLLVLFLHRAVNVYAGRGEDRAGPGGGERVS
jgi:hypothetical protein